MRKFSKFLTVLLTLALLCGVMLSVVAQAEEVPSREALNVSDAAHNVYTDFESGHKIPAANGWSDNAMAPIQYPTVDGNTYLKYTSKGCGTATNNQEAFITIAAYDWKYHRDGTHNIGAHDYVTIDFEIGTDSYTFNFKATVTTKVEGQDDVVQNNVTVYKTVATEEEYEAYKDGTASIPNLVQGNKTLVFTDVTDISDLDLAFIDGMNFNVHPRSVDKLSSEGKTNTNENGHSNFALYTVKDPATGKWYIGNASTYASSTAKIELSNKVGEFDHVTYVVKTARSASDTATTGVSLAGTTMYTFVNGNFLYEKDIGVGAYESVDPAWIRFAFMKNQNHDRFAICVDNVAINWYGYRSMDVTTTGEGESALTTYTYSSTDTVYVSDGYGVDDYITSGDYKLNGIWNCEDVVYSADYVAPNADKYVTVGGTQYYVLGAALEATKSGDALITSASYSGVNVPGYLTNFTVVANNGATFTLDAASAALYDVISTVDGETTTYNFMLYAEAITDKDRLNVTGDSANTITEFSDKALGKLASASGAGSFNANTNDNAIYREVILGADGTNKYLRHSWSGRYSPKAIEDTWFAGSQSANAATGVPGDVARADYVVWDFDFGTDMYSFSYTANVTSLVDGAGEPADVTLTKTVADADEFAEYVAEFAKYKADATENLESSADFATKYPLISQLIYSYTGTNTSSKAVSYTVNKVVDINADQKLELAYRASDGIGFTFRGYTYNADGTAFAASNKEAYGSVGSVTKKADGWYLVHGANEVKLSNEIGEFDHITLVHAISTNGTNANGRTLHKITTYAFVNGEYFTSTVGNNCGAYEMYVPQRLKITHPNGSLMSKGWAIVTDNFVSNYYDNYDNTNENGIGALITAIAGGDKSGKLYDCNDVLYNRDYADLGGYVSFDGGNTVNYIDSLVAEAADALVDGGTVITSKNLIGFTPKEGLTSFTVELLRGAKFTLSAEALNDLWFINPIDEDTLSVVRYSEEDAIAFEFLDNYGNVFMTQYLLPGKQLDTSVATEKMINLFEKETGTVKHATGWTLNAGNGVVNAEGYSFASLAAMPKTVTVTPTFEVDGILDTFAVYYIDADGLAKLDAAISSYPTAATLYDGSITSPGNVISSTALSTLTSKISGAVDGATLILLYDGVLDIGANNSLNLPTNKTFNIDLNGKKILHSYGSTSDYGAKMINFGERTTVNLYSSKPGAEIYQARYHSSSQGHNVFALGIFFGGDVHEATINVDGENLKVLGGSLVYYTGGTATKKAENIDDGKQVTINIDGGYYYSGLRSAYGVITTEGPDLYVNVSDATFVGINDSVYGSSFASRADRGGRIHVDAEGSTFVSMTNKGALNRLFYGAPVEGESAEFKNCTIYANNAGINSRVTIGEGCVVAGFNPSAANVAVDYAYGSDFSMSVTYPKLFAIMNAESNPIQPMQESTSNAGKFFLNSSFYGAYASLFWANDAKTSATYFTTEAEVVAAAKTVTWLGTDGNTLYTEKWINGSTVSEKKLPDTVDLDWYDVVYSWSTNKVSGDTVISPVAGVGGNDIKTKYADLALSTDMTFNMYLPVVDGVDVYAISIDGEDVDFSVVTKKIGEENVSCYVFSWNSAAGNFDVAVATVEFLINDDVYGLEDEFGSAEITLDVVRYAALVTENYGHGTEEANLVYEMMNYKEAVAALLDAEYARNEATEAFYALHAECECGVDMEVSDSEVADTDALASKGVTGVTFDLLEVGNIALIFEASSADLEIAVSYFDGREIHTVSAIYNSDAECYVTEAISAAYIDNILTVTVDGATGTYCLAAYIASDAVPAEAKAVATALYEYAMAAEAYKHITKAEAAQ